MFLVERSLNEVHKGVKSSSLKVKAVKIFLT